jgi:RND family efflux transporter MFP subunit
MVLVFQLFPLVAAAPAGAQEANEDLDCLIEPWISITLSTPVEGRVETMTVDRGDSVEEGQVVATLESSVEKAAVEIARARAVMDARVRGAQVRLDFAKRRVGRQQSLYTENAIAQHEMDEAESASQVAEMELMDAKDGRRVAQLELDRAEAALERRTIRSPIEGVVVRRILQPGEYADPPQLMELAQIDPLRVEIFAPFSLLGRIRVGMEAEVRPEPPVGGVHPAKVTVVDRVVDAASGSFGIRLELPNAESRMPAGLKCKVRFPVALLVGTAPPAGLRGSAEGPKRRLENPLESNIPGTYAADEGP